MGMNELLLTAQTVSRQGLFIGRLVYQYKKGVKEKFYVDVTRERKKAKRMRSEIPPFSEYV
jgi:hypothetical protein